MTRIRLAEVLGGLSFALDLTEGQPAGHILRTTLIGMALGERAGLVRAELADLYHALLLKDIGCTANASRTSALLAADDREVKPALKLTDLGTRKGRANWALRVVARHERPLTRGRTILNLSRGEGLHEALIRLRCERGRELALDLGFPLAVADAIGALDEHWDGEGHPDGLAGEAIPRFSRILLLAQTAEVFAAARGTREAVAVVQHRRGRWFDPALTPLVDAELLDGLPAATRTPCSPRSSSAPRPARRRTPRKRTSPRSRTRSPRSWTRSRRGRRATRIASPRWSPAWPSARDRRRTATWSGRRC